jgi:hypothetical protein
MAPDADSVFHVAGFRARVFSARALRLLTQRTELLFV